MNLAGVGRVCSVFHQGTRGSEQFREVADGGVRSGLDLGLQRGTEAGQHRSVDRVGLGALAGGLGEAANLPWINLDSRQAGLRKGILQTSVISTRCLEDDAGRLSRRDPGDQPGMACSIVVELLDAAFRVARFLLLHSRADLWNRTWSRSE